MSEEASFFVEGEPKAQPRPRAVIRGSRAGVFNPTTADAFKGCVRRAARDAGIENARMPGPLSVQIRFHMPRPASHYRGGDRAKPLKADAPQWHTVKPDADNLAKAVLDALTDADAWHDDSQVCDLHPVKLYADGPVGCEVTIKPACQ